ncbi:uncharacterized protein TNCV_3175141 [Trichonephila clavipes]|nr:uncharacterized protein TNCV_3175141 [Trichonephila clavipes]
MGLIFQHLLRYRNDGDDFLQHIVVGDENWCRHFEPECKSISMQWKHPDSPRPKQFKAQQLTRKVMLTAFFNVQELLLLYFKEPDVSINTQRYTQILDTLHKAIKNKHCRQVSSFCSTMQGNMSPRCVSRHWPVKSGKSWNIQLSVQICRLATITSLDH